MAASISHFVTTVTKFSCCSSNKNVSLSFAGLPPTFSFSLSFSCTIFQICGHDNQSKLNTLDTTDTETISSFRFHFYDSLVVFALKEVGGYVISRQNNHEFDLGCHTC